MSRILLTLLIAFYSMSLNAQSDDFRNKLSSQLSLINFEDTQGDITVNIALSDQFDFEAWKIKTAKQKISKHDKITGLINNQRQIARLSQSSLINYLKDSGANNIKSHWIANCVTATIDRKMLKNIALRSDVLWVGENALLKRTDEGNDNFENAPFSPNGRERGLTAINAHKMWALGYTGYGGVLFTADTGVDPTHPAIQGQYRGTTADDKSSWYSYENQPKSPYDCGSHGTHVTGTVLGLDRITNDTIGVAFNAQWIGGAILCGVGTADNIGAFEWSLNPDGDTTTTHDMPHVINNSWYDPSLGVLDCYSIYVPILELMEAAGIAVVFSAGNEGPDPNTITQPHNINIDELNTFTIGALNGNNANLPIATFSSRGPSHCPGEGSIKIKPEVSAPGVSVRSCVRNGLYGLNSGTSMAAPHVSGAILLLREAFPYLSSFDFKDALYNSCRDLGEVGEDNIFGKGIIDVYAAYEYLINKGNVPVAPSSRNDAAIVDVQHSLAACGNMISPVLTLSNEGTDTITTFTAQIAYSSDTLYATWQGVLAPKSLNTIIFEPMQIVSGNHRFKFTVLNPNGTADDRILNNSRYFNVLAIEKASILEPQTIKDGVCNQSKLILPEVKHPTLRTTTTWFKSPFGSDALVTNNSVITINPDLSTIYAEVKYYDFIGAKPSNPVLSDEQNKGIIFDAILPLKIDSIEICAATKGVRRFIAVDEVGDTIYNTQKYIKDGCYTIKFDWSFNAGRNFKIYKIDGDAIMLNTENIKYPYLDETGSMVVKGSADTTDTYPFFYNMRISYTDACGRTPFNFDAENKTTDANAIFDINKVYFTLPQDANLTAVNRSTNAANYKWTIGTDTFITQDLDYTFTAPGRYNLVLNAFDAAGCLTQNGRSILVVLPSSTDDNNNEINSPFAVYPNPSSSLLNIDTDGEFQSYDVTVQTMTGQVIKSMTKLKGQTTIDCSNVSSGVYFVTIIDQKQKAYTYKWLKI